LLIELLIVVAIIPIIAAIAIPNLLRSKMAANEASAVASLRTYNTSIVAYQTTYATDPVTGLSQLGPLAGGGTTPSSASADLVDSLLGSAIPKKERICLQLHAGCRHACHTVHHSGHSSVQLDRSEIFSHRPERCDLPDLGWQGPLDRRRRHCSNRSVILGSCSPGGEGLTLFSPLFLSRARPHKVAGELFWRLPHLAGKNMVRHDHLWNYLSVVNVRNPRHRDEKKACSQPQCRPPTVQRQIILMNPFGTPSDRGQRGLWSGSPQSPFSLPYPIGNTPGLQGSPGELDHTILRELPCSPGCPLTSPASRLRSFRSGEKSCGVNQKIRNRRLPPLKFRRLPRRREWSRPSALLQG